MTPKSLTSAASGSFYAGEDEYALVRAGVDVVVEDLTPPSAPAAPPPAAAGALPTRGALL